MLLRNKMDTLRNMGIIFWLMAICTNVVVKIPVLAASQGCVSVGFTEFIVLSGGLYFLYLLISKKYVLRGISKGIFIFLVGACTISVLVCLYHILYEGKMIIEYVGVLRNIYVCSLIYFLVDAGKIRLIEVKNGIALFISTMVIITFYNAMVVSVWKDLQLIYYPDNSYITVAGIPLIAYLAYEERTKLLRVLMGVVWIVSIPAVLIKGSRAAWTLAVVAIIVTCFCYLIKKEKMFLKRLIFLLIIGGTLTFSIAKFSGSLYVTASIMRASPIIRDIVITCVGESAQWEQVSDEYIENSSDFPDGMFSSEDILHIAITSKGSGARSNSIRMSAWKAFGEKIKDSPIMGFGERFVEIDYLLGGKIMVNAHNFILEIAALMGVIGVIAYLSLLIYIWVNIVFIINLEWHQKLIAVVSVGILYAFAMVQPTITGGITSNIVAWSIISCFLASNKECSYEKS